MNIKTKTPDEKRTAFVAWTNTDLTEGRGREVPLAVCNAEATARRIGNGRHVQGTDCPVREVELFLHEGRWYGPVEIHPASKEDKAKQLQIDVKSAAMEKAKAAGMTDEEIEALSK